MGTLCHKVLTHIFKRWNSDGPSAHCVTIGKEGTTGVLGMWWEEWDKREVVVMWQGRGPDFKVGVVLKVYELVRWTPRCPCCVTLGKLFDLSDSYSFMKWEGGGCLSQRVATATLPTGGLPEKASPSPFFSGTSPDIKEKGFCVVTLQALFDPFIGPKATAESWNPPGLHLRPPCHPY